MPTSPGPAHDVFLSYSRVDAEIAASVRAALEARGIGVFQDTVSIGPGERWTLSLDRGIQSSRTFVVLFSKASSASPMVGLEVDQAIRRYAARGHPIIPLLLDETPLDRPPGPEGTARQVPSLGSFQAIDLRPLDDDSHWSGRLDQLAAGILHQPVGKAGRTEIADDVTFLALFPQGVITVVFDHVVEERGIEKAVARARKRGVLVDDTEQGRIALAPGPGSDTAVSEAEQRALVEAIERCIADHGFYGGESVGTGLGLLVRDELALVAEIEADDEAWAGLRQRVVRRGRQAVETLLDEGQDLLAGDVTRQLLEVLTTVPADLLLLQAQIWLRLGDASRALATFDPLAGVDLFDGLDLTADQRLLVLQDWMVAAKSAGVGRERHQKLLAAYGSALELLDASGRDPERSAETRADLLLNRATQVAVYGKDEEWAGARSDLDAAEAAYEGLVARRENHALDHLIALHGSRISLNLHRLARGMDTEPDLADRLARGTELAAQADASRYLFFFLYVKGAYEHRAGLADQALESYADAKRVAHLCGNLVHREALAAWKMLRLEHARGAITAEELLDRIDPHVALLTARVRDDAWSRNALVEILRHDVRQAELASDGRDRALRAAAFAFDLAAFRWRRDGGRPIESADAWRRDGGEAKLREVFRDIRQTGPDETWKTEFVSERRDFFAELLGLSAWKITWKRVDASIP